jgi:hypothetical protein
MASLAIVLTTAHAASAAAGGFVYAVDQVNGGSNQIYGFRLSSVGTLTLLPGFPVASGGIGGAGSFRSTSPKGGLLYIVNEGSASLSVFSVDATTGA